jgi:hypothetical protein
MLRGGVIYWATVGPVLREPAELRAEVTEEVGAAFGSGLVVVGCVARVLWGRRGFKRCRCTAVPTMRVPSKVRHHARNKCSAPGRSLRNRDISLPIAHLRLSLSGVSTHDGIRPVVCKRALAHTYSILKHSR